MANTWKLESPNNLWVIGEQYYSLSWSLFTLAFSRRPALPYGANIADEADEEHRKVLARSIAKNGWGFVQILGNSHLACELALKSLLLHSEQPDGSHSFPKTHDLRQLLDGLPRRCQSDIEQRFTTWSAGNGGGKLNDALDGSADRFVRYRYRPPHAVDAETLATLSLARFFYEDLL